MDEKCLIGYDHSRVLAISRRTWQLLRQPVGPRCETATGLALASLSKSSQMLTARPTELVTPRISGITKPSAPGQAITSPLDKTLGKR